MLNIPVKKTGEASIDALIIFHIPLYFFAFSRRNSSLELSLGTDSTLFLPILLLPYTNWNCNYTTSGKHLLSHISENIYLAPAVENYSLSYLILLQPM